MSFVFHYRQALLYFVNRRHIIQTVTISLYRFDGVMRQIWAFAMMGLARQKLKKLNNLRFWKLLGSGTDQGFTPIPNFGVYAILCVWDTAEEAREFTNNSKVFSSYKSQSIEHATIYMEAVSSRGKWSHKEPFLVNSKDIEGPIAILTRATVRWTKLINFWKQSPSISQRIGNNKDVMFKVGLGEVPLRQQLTFSIWPNLGSMKKFAHVSGPHREAIDKVRSGNWFKEELYARFRVKKIEGYWPALGKLNNQEKYR